MRKIIIIIFFLTNCSLSFTQTNSSRKSKDGKVTAVNFISFDEGIDSVVVKNKKHKLKFSNLKPLFDFYDEENELDPEPIGNFFYVHSIEKIKNKVYMLVGVGGDESFGTELNLIFFKKNKILKYYVVPSHNKMLRDVSFEYLPKTREVIIPITKQYTPQNYIYEINLKENKFDIIKPTNKDINDKFHEYKLKIK